MIPGKSETLRISGSARIVRDADLRESMVARGKTPHFALALEVEEAFFYSRMVDAAAPPMPVAALPEIVTQDEEERLY